MSWPQVFEGSTLYLTWIKLSWANFDSTIRISEVWKLLLAVTTYYRSMQEERSNDGLLAH